MITEVAGAISGITGIIKPLVDRAVAESIDKEHQNYENDIQNGFMGGPDALWTVLQRLLLDSGHPTTPGGGSGENVPAKSGRFIDDESLHSLLLTAADCVQLRKYLVKAQAKLSE